MEIKIADIKKLQLIVDRWNARSGKNVSANEFVQILIDRSLQNLYDEQDHLDMQEIVTAAKKASPNDRAAILNALRSKR